MDIRHIDIDVTVKKWVGEEDEQNVYHNLLHRRMRISMNFPLRLEDEKLRAFLHERLDKVLKEIGQMEAINAKE